MIDMVCFADSAGIRVVLTMVEPDRGDIPRQAAGSWGIPNMSGQEDG